MPPQTSPPPSSSSIITNSNSNTGSNANSNSNSNPTPNPDPTSNPTRNNTNRNTNPSNITTNNNNRNNTNNNNVYTLFKRSHPYLITLLFATAKLTHPLLILSLSLNTNFLPLILSNFFSSSTSLLSESLLSSSSLSLFSTPQPSATINTTQLNPRSLLKLRTVIWYFASLSFWSRHVVAVLGVRWLMSRTRTDEQQQETPQNQ